MAAPGFRLEVQEALTSTSDLVAERAARKAPGALRLRVDPQAVG